MGAVDPARVVVALDPPESLCRSTKDLLIILIMRHLVRLLRVASHIFVLDAAALAIQVWWSFHRMGSCNDAVGSVAGGMTCMFLIFWTVARLMLSCTEHLETALNSSMFCGRTCSKMCSARALHSGCWIEPRRC